MSFSIGLVAIVCIFMFIIHLYHKKCFSYWRSRNVPYLEPQWFFGSARNEVLRRNSWFDFTIKCYKRFKHHGFGGYFLATKPVFVVCDPKLVEKILVTDFDYFQDRYPYKGPLMRSLLYLSGEKWRFMRLKLNAGFSQFKVKTMFDQTLRCADEVLAEINQFGREEEPFNVESLAFNFSADSIGSCAFGVQFTANSEEGNKFRKIINDVFGTSILNFFWYLLFASYPNLTSFLNLNIFMIRSEVDKYFCNLTESTIKFRRQNQTGRDDFLQMMMTLKEQEDNPADGTDKVVTERDEDRTQVERIKLESKSSFSEKVFSGDAIASVLLNFLTTGITPTVVTINFAAFEIAKNPAIQKRLHEEIDFAVAKHKALTYEALKNMTYLDQVVQETLRLYTHSSGLVRVVTKPYRVPGTNMTLEEGISVLIPIGAMHRDPQYYSSPEEFDPERFRDHNYKPNPFFKPFGDGPRICISMRFALMMVKVFLARIFLKFSVKVSEKTQKPLMFDVESFYPRALDGIWLTFHERCST